MSVLMGVVMCALLTTSCGGSASERSGARGSAAARQFDRLVSKENGYYYHPFLRQQPAGPQAQSFALRTLSELGHASRVRMHAAEVRSWRQGALETSSLWGRDWLIPLWQAGADRALGRRDATDVNKTRTKGGWYVDSALGDDDEAARLGSTWAALGVLDALGRLDDLPSADRAATVAWLGSVAERPHALDQSSALAGSLRLLKQPVPTALAQVTAPRTGDFADLSPDERATRLADTYSYVLIREAAGKPAVVDRTVWEPVLRDGAATLPYEQLYQLVHLLKAAGTPRSAFAPVLDRLDGARLADGTVREPDAFIGDPEASLFVQRLRALAGFPRQDPGLLRAMEREEKSGTASPEAAERLDRAALRTVTEDSAPGDTVRRLCADPNLVPTTVTPQNATAWQRTVLTCADAGAETVDPVVPAWRPNSADAVLAAATLTVGLADSDRRDLVPSWITAESLRRWARDPAPFASLYDYTLVVRAHVLLGGALDTPLRTALARAVTAHRGCPGLPDLYQVGAGDKACDLKTTWGVWALDHELDGAMGWLPDGTTRNGK
ncbi:hypothetical protein [Streptomyces xanthii]|uniref:Uncharacterized protein n=1 Tax=Streptomyces xanthii TaxID=2768069 RepID=A0A7H1BHT7_9ACTN|nr:hypothetical protein [Streptomyces xanthii]QNS08292.1 hypothetical protein IAG42_34945 [Streptomyces xanthii]